MTTCIVCRNRSVYPGSQYCSNSCRFSQQQTQQMCQTCKTKPVNSSFPGSKWCGNTCRTNTTVSGLQSTTVSGLQSTSQQNSYPTQGTPLCQICNNAAFFDTQRNTWAPGCSRTHTDIAKQRGLHTAR